MLNYHNYLTDDILITKAIWDRRSHLIDPVNGVILKLRQPWEPKGTFHHSLSPGIKS